MGLPRVSLRGGVHVADLRSMGGSQRQSLGVGSEASQLEVGVALARAMDACRLGAKVSQPELPGLDDGELRIDRLVEMYQEARDYDSDGGKDYVVGCCRRTIEAIGHLTVRDLCAPAGGAAFKAWRNKMWEDGLSPKTVRNHLNFAKAVLTWGQSDGRALTGPIPQLPKFCRPGEFLDGGKPCYDTMVEADFRLLREQWAEEASRTGAFKSLFRNPVDRDDYIARRNLYLSWAFYTGAHTEDCNTLRGEYLSVDVGRYERHNTKSSHVIRPEWFDMPEQLRLDCEFELRRRGIPRFQEGELPAGGAWRGTRPLARACKRLWPDGSRKPFTFRIARRSTVWEYTVRGWRTHEIAELLGHVDEKMVREIYRRCSELGVISPVRVPWKLASGPHGGPSRLATTLPFVGRKIA